MRVSAIGEPPLHIAHSMSEQTDKADFGMLLDALRGADEGVQGVDWSAWDAMIGEWVSAYPAFGAGRMLRAKTARESRALAAGERLAEAAVFSSEPGRLFDLLFRSGIEAEIATFARAVEALEPEVEEAIRLRWHPEPEHTAVEDTVHEEEKEETSGSPAEPVVEDAAEEEPEKPRVEIPEEGSLAREVVLGAIERSIEKEIREFSEAAPAAGEDGERREAPRAEAPLGKGAQPTGIRRESVDVARLSPLARWAFERSEATGFGTASDSVRSSEALRSAAQQIEQVMASGGEAEGLPADGQLDQQAALIDLFIRNEPTIGPVRPEIERPAIKELAKESLVEDASLITETMARIYAAQGQIGRARRAYKLLALKYPEKSVYFAAQSKKLGRKPSDD